MDGFAGLKTAAAEELPDAVPVMDPFHVVRLAGDALGQSRRRVQQDLFGRRGMKNHPLYKARRTLHTGADLLTDKQKIRLDAVFGSEQHVEVEATWGMYQRIVAAYREPDKKNQDDDAVRGLDHRRGSRRARRDPQARPHHEAARRRHPRVLRPPRHIERADRGHQRTARAPPRLRTRIPQPHELRRAQPARGRGASDPTYTLDSEERR